jgi:hypothetical protein
MHLKHSQGDKTLTGLHYGAFVDSLLSALPEIKQRHDALLEDIGPDVLPYPAVELVLEPFVKDLLKAEADDVLLRRVFAFLEEMARAQDVEVVNLLYVGLFEAWVGDPETLAGAWKHMGERTKQIASDAAYRLKREDNLPRAARR